MNERDPIESLADIRHEFGEHGGVNMSIEASTTFTVMEPGTIPDIFSGVKNPAEGGCYLYGRHFNPTVYNLGRQIAALEGCEAAYCTSSGMGAIAAAILHCCKSGDEIVASNAIYGGTYALLHDFLPAKAGIHTVLVDINDHDAVQNAMTENTKAIFAESLSNPTLRVANVSALARIAQRHNTRLIIDNTFSPLLFAPVEFGADIVVHSMTKFISGASDIIAGAVCADEMTIQSLMDLQMGPIMLLGPTMDPTVAFNLSMRVPHLPLRMAEHSRRAGIIAEMLNSLGLDVMYPGLANHPDHELAQSQFREAYGFGGVLTLDVGDEDRANRLMDILQNQYRFGYMAVSLGYFDTLMSCSASSTSSELNDADLASAGISPSLIRISVGYTGSLNQRLEQLSQALKDVGLT